METCQLQEIVYQKILRQHARCETPNHYHLPINTAKKLKVIVVIWYINYSKYLTAFSLWHPTIRL